MSNTKSVLERFSVTIEQELLEAFDRFVGEKGYATRSEAVRDMVRDTLIKKEWADPEAEAAGAVVLVYNHHERQVSEKLTSEQHKAYHTIVASLHVHLDAENCMEIVALRGKTADIRKVADALTSMKGVKHGRFIETSSGKYV